MNRSETIPGMNELDSIRKFEYRPCRIRAGLKVEFVTENQTLAGRCNDVSDEGIRATLDGSTEVGCSGILILRHPACVLEVEAQAAYVDKCQVGLAFLFRSPWERAMTVDFIASVADNLGSSTVIPFP
jgi:hypothetical protein